MHLYRFEAAQPLQFVMTGKFVAPSPAWRHMQRVLFDFELFVPIEGTLYIADSLGKHALRKGDFLLMPPGTRQFGYQSSECSFYWLHFKPEAGAGGYAEADEPPPEAEADSSSLLIPRKGRLGNIDKLIVMMKQLQDSVRSYQHDLLNDYLLTSILCELYNQTVRNVQLSRPRLKQLQLYNDIVDYIRRNRFERLSVGHIAEYFGYNAKYFSHMFAQFAGMPLKQFVIQQKIDAASFLLADTNMSVDEIAMQLGYCDSHHFMKSFKQKTSLTPTGYRNAMVKRLLNQ